ncbi:uncharacterized protein LOC136033595 [Artemia franciscana]|uniref:J domain-containing protein n=2 Tax=Artemia franciscana TaxID=6661 RepID=A0AA88I9M4_ARTSF|nr:hypothetical protein QYM36_002451 [Artemia franciscana]KAK2724113.1 hypothetical protein QYM36_002451 [Artemia franciscana]KAK2724114.1 hypothetical protein QYM36_002451 [Artemia franciscana]
MKNVVIAYILFFIGGLFGLHLLYLGRLKHTACFLTTFCGFFGLSLIYDLFYMPYYVREANFEKEFQREWRTLKVSNPKPPIDWAKLICQFSVGNLWASLFVLAIPLEDYEERLVTTLDWFAPLVCALGIYTVGNIGLQESGLLAPVVGAYIPAILTGTPTSSLTLESFFSCLGQILFSRRWKKEKVSGFSLKNVLYLIICLMAFWGMILSYFYFNAEILDGETGESVKVRDALRHFFNSPLWKNFYRLMEEFFHMLRTKGFSEAFEFLSKKLDPSGRHHALEVMNLTKDVSMDEIRQRWRELSKVWHPDRFQDPREKDLAQIKFIEINEAYSVLSSKKMKRS